jgi:hypothetical protein
MRLEVSSSYLLGSRVGRIYGRHGGGHWGRRLEFGAIVQVRLDNQVS